MNRFAVAIATLTLTAAAALADSFAASVVSYSPGTTPATRSYTNDFWATVGDPVLLSNPTTALGKPATFVVEPYQTGADRIVSPFIPPANEDQIVSIGKGGQITLRLNNYALVGAGREIGLFTNTLLFDTWVETPPGSWNYVPQGIVASPLTASGVHDVVVDVSEDGLAWTSLGSVTVGMITNPFLNSATPYAASTAGLIEADYAKPFAGALDDFAGKTYAEIKAALDGSAGGTWLDLSATGLTQVGYVRVSIPADDPSAAPHFELDAVSVNGALTGGTVPAPEPGTLALLALGACLLRRRTGRQG
ncbi:MAG: PEP-CTERM sorting domain-containing protein [Planctomycetota bacterium]|nr:PEP-CTERM sorting domain-containing protein [Planctomycetota bacterium]